MEKFNNKYRIPSARLLGYDYSASGAYFITICTKNRHHFFGKIIDGKMHLSKIGEIAHNEWLKTFDLRLDMNLQMGEFVVMPDHFHAVIIIGGNGYNMGKDAMHRVSDEGKDAMHRVSMQTDTDNPVMHHNPDTGKGAMHRASSQMTAKHRVSTFGPQSKNLASIMRGYKSAVTMQARVMDENFGWQTRFYDHIIRDATAFEIIQRYIARNPEKWEIDLKNKLNNSL